MFRLLSVGLLAAVLTAATSTTDAIEAHRRADLVLYPALVSAMNEYSLDHTVADLGHFNKFDAKDIRNIRAVRETFKSWDETMKRAGY